MVYGHVSIFCIFRGHVFEADMTRISEHVGKVFTLNMVPHSDPGLESYLANSAFIAFLMVFPYKLKQLFWILKGFP